MSQLLLNVKDKSKMQLLLKFLQSLEYLTVEKLPEETILVSETDKALIRQRYKKAKPEQFKNWDEIKSQL